jgi:hypothetical protein
LAFNKQNNNRECEASKNASDSRLQFCQLNETQKIMREHTIHLQYTWEFRKSAFNGTELPSMVAYPIQQLHRNCRAAQRMAHKPPCGLRSVTQREPKRFKGVVPSTKVLDSKVGFMRLLGRT